MTLCDCEMPVDHHFFVEQSQKKKLHHQPKAIFEMFTAGTDTPANKTQEAKHRQNNNVLNVTKETSYSFERGSGPLTAPRDLQSC